MKKKTTPGQRDQLFKAAVEAQKRAYLLKGNEYRVGAAVLAKNGEIFTGCNIENAALGPTICAERVALFKAYSEGQREIVAMVLVTDEGGACCGTCRQVISELAPHMEIIITDKERTKEVLTNIDELLPLKWSHPLIG